MRMVTWGKAERKAQLYVAYGLPRWLRNKKKKNTPAKQETWVQSLRWEDPLEKKKRSCILAGEIPWTEKPDGLQSVGSQIVGHNLATEQQRPTFKHHCLKYQILLYFCFNHQMQFIKLVRRIVCCLHPSFCCSSFPTLQDSFFYPFISGLTWFPLAIPLGQACQRQGFSVLLRLQRSFISTSILKDGFTRYCTHN